MHSMLLVIEKPAENDTKLIFHWTNLVSYIKELESNNAPIGKLSENVFLIPVGAGLNYFISICAKAQSLPYRCIFFHDKPEWVESITGANSVKL